MLSFFSHEQRHSGAGRSLQRQRNSCSSLIFSALASVSADLNKLRFRAPDGFPLKPDGLRHPMQEQPPCGFPHHNHARSRSASRTAA